MDLGTWIILIAVVISTISLVISWVTHRNQILLTRWQFLLPIWEKMISIREIIPNSPNANDVRAAINVLELIAVCWQGRIADRDVVRILFADQYMRVVSQIKSCACLGAEYGSKSGSEILLAIPAVEDLYEELQQLKRGSINLRN